MLLRQQRCGYACHLRNISIRMALSKWLTSWYAIVMWLYHLPKVGGTWRKLLPHDVIVSIRMSTDNRVEKRWCCRLRRRNLLLFWIYNVGDHASSSKKEIFWALLLHSSTLHTVRNLLRSARWWHVCQQSGRRNFPVNAWPVSKILPVSKECWCNFCNILSMWIS